MHHFSTPINFELRPDVLNFLLFQPHLFLIIFKILRASMSILATIFVKLFNFNILICLSKSSFAALAVSKNCKSQKRCFFQRDQLPKNFLVGCAEQQPSALLFLISFNFACKSKKHTLKFYLFESVQNLVFFIDLKFFFLFLIYFYCYDWHF